MEYGCVYIESQSPEEQEILLAYLEDTPLESFEILENKITAYWSLELYNAEEIKEQLLNLPIDIAFTFADPIPWKNWNEEWESNYHPVYVNDTLCVRAPFHSKSDALEEIIIQAKMSFGTGHHITTRLMLSELQKIKIQGLKVLDFGSGTGVLGIYCMMKECSHLTMIDHEPWTIENMKENLNLNRISENYELICGELNDCEQNDFDLIVANINKSVLIEYSSSLNKKLNQSGIIMVSGILLEDESDIVKVYEKIGFKKISSSSENEWLLLSFIKNM